MSSTRRFAVTLLLAMAVPLVAVAQTKPPSRGPTQLMRSAWRAIVDGQYREPGHGVTIARKEEQDRTGPWSPVIRKQLQRIAKMPVIAITGVSVAGLDPRTGITRSVGFHPVNGVSQAVTSEANQQVHARVGYRTIGTSQTITFRGKNRTPSALRRAGLPEGAIQRGEVVRYDLGSRGRTASAWTIDPRSGAPIQILKDAPLPERKR
jgi:hypothetical protein